MFCFTGCTTAFKKKQDPEPTIVQSVSTSMSQEEAQKVLGTGTKNWAFGQGVGDTAVKVAGSILFPPYLVYVLGNGAIELAGYHGVYVSDALPEPYDEGWNGLYNSVTSVPGRTISTLSGSEYRSEEKIKQDGGFWGTKPKSTAIAYTTDQYLNDSSFEVASGNQDVRNDLYGTNRSGS